MSFVRDIFSPQPRTNVPLTVVTTPQEHDYVHQDGSTQPGPSSTHQPARPTPRRTHSLPGPIVPPYDEDEEDFNARAVPRRSADRSRLYPPSAGEATHSVCSSATNTPVPSRSSSPFPFYYSGASSCSSDSESEPDSPLLSGSRRPTSSWRNGERPRWWQFRLGSRGSSAGSTDAWRRRRRFRDVSWGLRSCKRLLRRLVRHPFFPKTPVTIVSPVRSLIHVSASGHVASRRRPSAPRWNLVGMFAAEDPDPGWWSGTCVARCIASILRTPAGVG